MMLKLGQDLGVLGALMTRINNYVKGRPHKNSKTHEPVCMCVYLPEHLIMCLFCMIEFSCLSLCA